MTPITYLDGSSTDNDPARLCRRKAMDCQRTALTTADPRVRLRYLHLATLWREMAEEAERRPNNTSLSKGRGIVIFVNRFQKSPVDYQILHGRGYSLTTGGGSHLPVRASILGA